MYKAIRFHKKTGVVLGTTIKDVGWSDDGICGVHVLPPGGDWPAALKALKAGKACKFDGAAIVESGPADATYQQAHDAAGQEYADRAFAESRRKILSHPRGLTRALVRVVARKLGVTPKALMAEVRAEAGL